MKTNGHRSPLQIEHVNTDGIGMEESDLSSPRSTGGQIPTDLFSFPTRVYSRSSALVNLQQQE